jgi:hydroxymethylglutaryl-CoA synthase
MQLGSAVMEELGNLYTGALPAWLAAGLEQAAQESIDLTDKEVLLFGYGSGDAAEAMPIVLVPGWEQAATKTDIAGTLGGAVDLDETQYRALRKGNRAELNYQPNDEFVVERVGAAEGANFQDKGIEYYRFID